MRFVLQINGDPREVEAEEDVRLLDLLRDTLKLKGARFGCGSNACGACYVLIDGQAVASCDTPLWAAAGKDIVTVEGLGSETAPHPLQQAFIDQQAAQCGYCTSGMLVSAAALLRRNPHPDEQEVREALDRNLCRCGSHNRIVRAVMQAAEQGNAS
ncbi:nicotinate dehydrogenase subunit A [Noviherbaspirillum humi]|uniref:Nicotinate dehydrogenase subunit A n=1 Tax=Noviherbaspirillum humi TaxID=1688639 RepID=A0A239KIF9_9BURK|nr:(2Fe-2S)-binding protein [Noviherbaspirillum humi]SNT18137.1 nicotinate dehydrogenase subunit A [Noviherbaspirillum humi]